MLNEADENIGRSVQAEWQTDCSVSKRSVSSRVAACSPKRSPARPADSDGAWHSTLEGCALCSFPTQSIFADGWLLRFVFQLVGSDPSWAPAARSLARSLFRPAGRPTERTVGRSVGRPAVGRPQDGPVAFICCRCCRTSNLPLRFSFRIRFHSPD